MDLPFSSPKTPKTIMAKPFYILFILPPKIFLKSPKFKIATEKTYFSGQCLDFSFQHTNNAY
jgi:hypothetical protein